MITQVLGYAPESTDQSAAATLLLLSAHNLHFGKCFDSSKV